TLDHIRDADWSPDGTTLAVVHSLANRHDQLEYPAGTPLCETTGYFSDLRVSHDGRRIAFLDHADQFDNRGRVRVVDTAKHVITLSDEYPAVEGLSWSADDQRVMFSAGNAHSAAGLQPLTVSSTGGSPVRVALPSPGDMIILDVARDGRWLL